MTSPIRPVSLRYILSPRRGAYPFATIGAVLFAVSAWPVLAQDSQTELPEITVTTSAPQPKAPRTTQAPASTGEPQPQALSPADAFTDPAGAPVRPGTRSGSLTVPTTAEAAADIQRTPGGVDLVRAEDYKATTPAITIKDALDYVPGVFVQPKWGEDARLSIRGSGLSRNFHLRGTQLFMDGIPISTADGFGDFQEIDPTVYRYIEVFKGANALRFGANALGGAINFVMPTGYDANVLTARTDLGSFGFRKFSSSSGGVSGPVDYFIAGTWQEWDGYREHSWGESLRGSMNLGYRLSENVETRFYVNANDVAQRIPGAVTRQTALTDSKEAAAINVLNDWQRNIETLRIANKTTVRLSQGTLLEFGAFNVDRHLDHPIYQWLDYRYDDYGGFARLSDDSVIAGFRNRFIAGVNLHNGKVDTKHFANGPNAAKGPLIAEGVNRSDNISVYAENSFFVLPDVALVAGLQFLHAERNRIGTDVSGRNTFDVWSPKAGIVWDVDPGWQVFANISRSAEVPSFGENAVSGSAFAAKLQEATTYEIGTRGRRETYHWDVALYRAEIDNELQCLTILVPFPNMCSVTNADKTVHQGLELGFGAAVLQSLLVDGPTPDRLWLTAAYTLNDFHFDNDAVWGDNELPGLPRHFLRAELMYRHPSGVFFGPNVEWAPSAYFVDNANTLKTEGYAIWGAKLGYEGETFTAYIEGRNLSDRAYIASASVSGDVGGTDGAYFEPGTGRALYGGVQVKW